MPGSGLPWKNAAMCPCRSWFCMLSHAWPPSACTMASSAARACVRVLRGLLVAGLRAHRMRRHQRHPDQRYRQNFPHRSPIYLTGPCPLASWSHHSLFPAEPQFPALHPTSTAPPFTFSISPVINPASGVHRNNTGPAISRGVATRPTGIAAAIFGPSRDRPASRPTYPSPPIPAQHSLP